MASATARQARSRGTPGSGSATRWSCRSSSHNRGSRSSCRLRASGCGASRNQSCLPVVELAPRGGDLEVFAREPRLYSDPLSRMPRQRRRPDRHDRQAHLHRTPLLMRGHRTVDHSSAVRMPRVAACIASPAACAVATPERRMRLTATPARAPNRRGSCRPSLLGDGEFGWIVASANLPYFRRRISDATSE